MAESDALIALMEQDLATARAVKALDELPEKMAILKLRHRLKEIAAMRETADAQCRQSDALVKRAEDGVESIQTKIDAEQRKVLSGEVSNSKELQALTRELDALRRKKDVAEREQLELMEKAEECRAQLAKIQATLEEGARREADLILAFKKRGGDLQSEIARMKESRAQLAAELPSALLARYEKARQAKHGIAVGVFDGAMCSACRTQIPAGEAQAINAGPEIAECPNCRRILIVRGTA